MNIVDIARRGTVVPPWAITADAAGASTAPYLRRQQRLSMLFNGTSRSSPVRARFSRPR
jgi:hypothetical protein